MNKTIDPIGENLKSKRKERGLSVPELSLLISIPADRIYKWESGKASPKYEDRQFLEKWINSEDWKNIPSEIESEVVGYPEKTLNNLTESNKVLAEANKTLAEANKTLAEANHVISKNHDELIQLTKMIVANSQALPKSQAEAFGPENNVVTPGFAAVTPSGTQMTTDKSKGKH